MKYETSYLVSDLGDVRDNYPQKAHVDLLPDITETEWKEMKIKSLIGFTPINEDGMMLAVWIDNMPKKYRSKEEIKEDEERLKRDMYVAPSQYFMYIPRGVFIALPGDTIHTGGFCFGRKEVLPVPRNKKSTRDRSLTCFRTIGFIFSFVCLRSATSTSKVKPTLLFMKMIQLICTRIFFR